LKVLVAYYSETGNTEKVARAIHDEASKKHQSHLRKIAEIAADTFNN
jgi:flavodoxin